jgi:hypothetical protein
MDNVQEYNACINVPSSQILQRKMFGKKIVDEI